MSLSDPMGLIPRLAQRRLGLVSGVESGFIKANGPDNQDGLNNQDGPNNQGGRPSTWFRLWDEIMADGSICTNGTSTQSPCPVR